MGYGCVLCFKILDAKSLLLTQLYVIHMAQGFGPFFINKRTVFLSFELLMCISCAFLSFLCAVRALQRKSVLRLKFADLGFAINCPWFLRRRFSDRRC
jgi:hypothetical protein